MTKYLPHGTHILLDLSNVDEYTLNSFDILDPILTKAIELSGAHLLKKTWHKFEPCGLTALYLLSESHLSIHTYCDELYCAIDIFTCGSSCNPSLASEHIIKSLHLSPQDVCCTTIERGRTNTTDSRFCHTINSIKS